MAWNREQSTCDGRGFVGSDADGFLANFYNWVTRSPVASPAAKSTGGPGWYIHDDQSKLSDEGAPNKDAWVETASGGVGTSFDTLAEIQAITNGEFAISIDGNSADVTGLDFSSDTTWAQVAATIQAGIRAADAATAFTQAVCQHYEHLNGNDPRTAQDDPLKHSFRIVAGDSGVAITAPVAVSGGAGTDISGSGHLNMSSGATGDETKNPFIVVSDQNAPAWDDGAKFLEVYQPTDTAGQIWIRTWMGWNSTIHRGFGLVGYHVINTTDDGIFVYDFRGGDEALCISSRRGSTWNHFMIDTFTGDANVLEADTADGVLASDVAAGASSFDLGAGEGSDVTDEKFYFLIDLDNSEAVDYVQIDSIATDTITTKEALIKTHKAGALFKPYFPRFYCLGTDVPSNRQKALAPLHSYRTQEWGNDNVSVSNGSWSTCQLDAMFASILQCAPDDDGNFRVQKPRITEGDPSNGAGTSTNRDYGAGDNVYITAKGTMAEMLDGKTISANNWLYFATHSNVVSDGGQSSAAVLVPDFDTT